VFFSWDGGLESLRSAARPARAGYGAHGLGRSFLESLSSDPSLSSQRPPSWLNPLYFPLPQVGALAGAHAQVFELAERQPPALQLVRLAEFHRAGHGDARATETLRESLAIEPNVPALALLAQLQHLQRDSTGFAASVSALRGLLAGVDAPTLELADHLNVVVALGLARDVVAASEQLRLALAHADENDVRHTPPQSLLILIGMSRGLGLDRGHEALLELAIRLLPGPERASLAR
jgi:hypothetical protein